MSSHKANARWQAGAYTAEDFTTKNSIRGILKQLIVSAACWGLLPIPSADWLIRHLHVEAA